MTSKDGLIQAFHTTRSFQWDSKTGFKLASGHMSPFYIDCRVLMAEPNARHLVARCAWDLVDRLEIDCLGGLEIGAISIATSISDFAYLETPKKEWRTFVVRKQPKDHGLGKLIEGAVGRGDRALIVDDVLTSGGSILNAIAVAREAELDVRNVLVIVDRKEQNGRARVEEQGVTVMSLLTIDDLTQGRAAGPEAEADTMHDAPIHLH